MPDDRSPRPRFERAVVVGGSIVGLAAARVLADHFDRVTIIERDPRPSGPDPRKGAPQMRHLHAMLEPAVKVLRGLFPGLVDEMIAGGALRVDPGAVSGWYHYGGWKPRFTTDIEVLLCSRPFIEQHVRRRVTALPNVEIRHEHTVEELLADPSKARVTGVRITGPSGEEALSADLVLDAAGRGTRAPRWLEALGYGRPEEEQVGIDLGYTSRVYERPAGFAGDWRFLAVYSSPPARRCGLAIEIEHNRWIVSLNGYFKDHPPADDEGFLAFARSLPVPHLHDAIRDAKPLTPASTHKIPTSRWLHYEKMPRFPERLLLLGDSVCALNPIYGQGMTVALQCVLALAKSLDAPGPRGGRLDGLGRTVQKQVSGLVAEPWLLSTTMDLRFPEAEGKRPPGLSAVQWAFANLIDLSSVDERACRTFYEMLHMRRGTAALLRPEILFPFLRYSVKSAFVPQADRVNRTMPPAPPT